MQRHMIRPLNMPLDVIDWRHFWILWQNVLVRDRWRKLLSLGAPTYGGMFRKGNINYSDGNRETSGTFQVDFWCFPSRRLVKSVLNYPVFCPVIPEPLKDWWWRSPEVVLPVRRGALRLCANTLTEFAFGTTKVYRQANQRNCRNINISRKIFYNQPADPLFWNPGPSM